MLFAASCSNFEVGTREWTDCVKDAATGGGLMPWIVVIPLGVMVVGMLIGFMFQFSAAGRKRAAQQGAAGVAGSWLIFSAILDLSVAAGALVASGRGGGAGFSMSGIVLSAVGIVMLVVGLVAKTRGRRRRSVYTSGVRGQGTIHGIAETGMFVNNNPMYELDLEVAGPGIPPTRTKHRESVPLIMIGTLKQGATIPVIIDPKDPKRVVLDWVRPHPSAQSGEDDPGSSPFTPVGPQTTTETPAALGQTFSPSSLTGGVASIPGVRGGLKAAGAVVIVLVVAVLGVGVYFVSSVMRTVTDVTDSVSEGVDEALDAAEDARKRGSEAEVKLAVSRTDAEGATVGYSILLPLGWQDITQGLSQPAPAVVIDFAITPAPASGPTNILIARSKSYLDDPAPRDADVDAVMSQLRKEFGPGAILRSRRTTVAGEEAVALDLRPQGATRARQIVFMRRGQVFLVTLTTGPDDWEARLPLLDEVLGSWAWDA